MMTLDNCAAEIIEGIMTTPTPPLPPSAPPPVAPATGCADCGCEIRHGGSPRDMWEMEDGRTVCHKCAVAELRRFTEVMRLLKEIDGIIKAK